VRPRLLVQQQQQQLAVHSHCVEVYSQLMEPGMQQVFSCHWYHCMLMLLPTPTVCRHAVEDSHHWQDRHN
jgi:hypothetical protein